MREASRFNCRPGLNRVPGSLSAVPTQAGGFRVPSCSEPASTRELESATRSRPWWALSIALSRSLARAGRLSSRRHGALLWAKESVGCNARRGEQTNGGKRILIGFGHPAFVPVPLTRPGERLAPAESNQVKPSQAESKRIRLMGRIGRIRRIVRRGQSESHPVKLGQAESNLVKPS